MNPVTGPETARIDELLGAFRELQAQFDLVRERLRRADEHRHTVARRIYDRVRSDYDRELDAIRARLTPLRDELDRVHESLEAQCREADAAAQAIEEELSEAGFRHRIGEYQPVAFDEMRRALDARAAEARARQNAMQSALDAIAAARATGTPAGPDPATASPDAADHTADIAALPETDTSAFAITTPADTAISAPVASTAPDDDDFSSLIVDEPPSLQRAHEIVASQEASAAEHAHDSVEEAPASDAEVASVLEPAASAAIEAPAVASTSRMDSFVNPQAWVSEMGADAGRPERRARVSVSAAAPARPVTPAMASSNELESALAPLEASVATAAATRTAAPAPEPVASLPSLVFVSGPHAGQAIALLPTTLTIGREHDNNVEIKDADVARYHARILRERDAFVVEDLNSSTGTWVNGERKTRAVLSHGDVIRVGQTELALDFEWTTDSR